MKKIYSFLLCFVVTLTFAAKPKHQYVCIKTDLGTCIVMLSNETPLHRDNFVKLTKQGLFTGTLFHRVIKDFMIQGGDPDSKNAKPGEELGNGTVGYTVPAEFRDSLFHKKGALAAARDDNPEKASSGSQFYLVQGKVYTDEQLDKIETGRLKARIPEWQRAVYKTTGGTPQLDKRYTVFGQVVQGLDLIDQVAALPTDSNDRPKTDLKMEVTLLKRREAKKLEKVLLKQEKQQQTISQ